MKSRTFQSFINQRVQSPRLAMFLILNLCGLVGFLTSFALARYAGLNQMWIRYLIGLILAYIAFFALIKIWLVIFFDKHGHMLKYVQDGPEESKKKYKKSKRDGKDKSNSFDADFGSFDFGDEGFLVVILLTVLFSVLLITGFFIAAAPAFFSEVLGTALLSSGMYRGLTRMKDEDWWQTVFRRSIYYFLGLALTFGLAGFALQLMQPEAVTIGDIFRN